MVVLEKHFFFIRGKLQDNSAVCYWYAFRCLYKNFMFSSWEIQGGNDSDQTKGSDDWTGVQKGKNLKGVVIVSVRIGQFGIFLT